MPHSIKITGIAPPDLPGQPEPLRRQFWSIVAPIALKVKDAELAAGLDAQGEPLRPISPRTRKYRRSAMTPSGKGDPSAPPLMPARQKSRVRSLLAARAFATHCELYWRYDPFTGASFDQILNYQRAMGRDVFGISESGLATVKKQSWAEWAKWKRAGLAPTEKRSAFPAAALSAGPQSRIAGIIARSAEPNAGATAPVGVGSMSTRWITRGIEAPLVKNLKASATRSGAMTGPDWRRFFTAEEAGGRGAVPARPRAPKPAAPVVARVAMGPTAERKPILKGEPLINEVHAIMKTMGVASQSGTIAQIEAAMPNHYLTDKIPAMFDPRADKVWINTEAGYWANPAKVLKLSKQQHWFAVNTPEQVAYHEATHALHLRSVTEAEAGDREKAIRRTGQMTLNEFPIPLRRLIQKQVGRYAALNESEFVAEVGAAIRQGKVFSDEIMALYRKLLGPLP